ncbi:peptidase [Pseudoduganella sp. DS3]|uniref:Peptidase n=1 Tax=Pseudoduganella guangdongensis TaxID=2692179 RepID=A0A6N9HPE5_9BURK|nr:SapC family protein [Pseudoduganella guangdongensis]MYN05276.1 peptidase [Pseudoduganella guangdongensis]
MANHVLLNNIDHKDLHVQTARGAGFGDDVMSALTFPSEFRDIQACYPIVFRQAADGSYEAHALFGLQDGENLFLGQHGWDAPYLPLSIARQPFLIGINGTELMVHVDLDHPRIGRSAGAGDGGSEPLFRPHGGTSEYLERVSSTLLAIHQGLQQAGGFLAALQEHQLLEPFVLDIELDDGTPYRLAGCHTINEERLAALPGAALENLHRAGYLQPIYMVLASISNFRTLIERKNRRHAGRC